MGPDLPPALAGRAADQGPADGGDAFGQAGDAAPAPGTGWIGDPARLAWLTIATSTDGAAAMVTSIAAPGACLMALVRLLLQHSVDDDRPMPPADRVELARSRAGQGRTGRGRPLQQLVERLSGQRRRLAGGSVQQVGQAGQVIAGLAGQLPDGVEQLVAQRIAIGQALAGAGLDDDDTEAVGDDIVQLAGHPRALVAQGLGDEKLTGDCHFVGARPQRPVETPVRPDGHAHQPAADGHDDGERVDRTPLGRRGEGEQTDHRVHPPREQPEREAEHGAPDETHEEQRRIGDGVAGRVGRAGRDHHDVRRTARERGDQRPARLSHDCSPAAGGPGPVAGPSHR